MHRSATSIILEATDVISSEAVAIKFISEKDQFDAEISARKLSCGNEGEADDKVREHTTIVPIIETSATLGSWHSRLKKMVTSPQQFVGQQVRPLEVSMRHHHAPCRSRFDDGHDERAYTSGWGPSNVRRPRALFEAHSQRGNYSRRRQAPEHGAPITGSVDGAETV